MRLFGFHLHRRLLIPISLIALLAVVAPSSAAAVGELTPVDDRDDASLEASASLAFHAYLETIDAGEIDAANDQALDPGSASGRLDVMDRLLAFMKARIKNPVRNEAMVIRSAGDWAMVVYQYDTTVAGKTARVITTAWMVQWEGYWRQFIVAPADASFWDTRRSDYERLQQWFDEHAEELTSAA
ncbi:MAG: hypothetical protein ACE37H_14575 [Phycisphaeraceae bacterium]